MFHISGWEASLNAAKLVDRKGQKSEARTGRILQVDGWMDS